MAIQVKPPATATQGTAFGCAGIAESIGVLPQGRETGALG